MNQPKLSSYSCWRFVFSERTGTPTAMHPDGIIPLDNITVCGKNYVQVPASYRYDRKRDIIMTIYGTNKTSEVKVLSNVRLGNYTGPAKQQPGTLNPLFRCAAVCDGNLYQGQSYAYALKIYEKATTSQPNGTGETYMSLEGINSALVNNEIVVPYFGFYSVTQANAWAGARSNNTMTIEQYRSAFFDYPISPMLNTDQLEGGVVIRDPNGTPINLHTDYYMIKKDLGPFENDNQLLTGNYDSWGSDCNNGNATLVGFINFFNNYALEKPNNFVELACWGNGYSVSDEGDLENSSPCGEETYNSFNQDIDVWEVAQWMAGCNPTADPHLHPHIIVMLELAPIGGGNPNPIYSSKSEFARIGEKITVPANLYKLKVAFSDGTYKELVIEAKQTYTYTASIKDLVAPLIYPVPIIGDKFTVQLESSIATSFLYELWDGNGHKILTRKMEVGVTNGTPYDINVNSDSPIPSGTLIHKFIFSDGSIRTINTLK
ncbi:MAG: hypothetical protein HYR91_01315 [Flavobacteriia bacterium]|nr:hypothetical protein [Flavobacteriia bacterium]